MRRICTFAFVVAIAVVTAAPAMADDFATTRDIEAAVDSYLAESADASLVGGPGSAGYEAGFYIRGGDFLLRINATIQARFEAWDYDDEDEAQILRDNINDNLPFAGDTSGFSLPRATLKLSGEAPCNICYYIELEFGHFGRDVMDEATNSELGFGRFEALGPGAFGQSYNYDNTREAWIEWCYGTTFNVRMGQVRLPTTRQLLTLPELQQFVDISLASSMTGAWGIGYTDRNRDHGILVHGTFGCNNEWSYMASISNGDGGDSIRNVIDHRTSDNLAFGGRINWAFLAPIGYEEGALRQQTCQWYGEAGGWFQVYDDRADKAHGTIADYRAYGLDVALGYGGWSFSAAVTQLQLADFLLNATDDFDMSIWFAQIGYHFTGTAWEIAARASSIDMDFGGIGSDGTISEYAFGVNYYLNGHGNKLQLDVSFLSTDDQGFLLWDPLPGYQTLGSADGEDATLIRFQWQLAL